MSESGLSIQMPADVAAALDRAVRQRRTSQSELIVAALRQYLGVHDLPVKRQEAERVCREINEADALDAELWPWMESMYADNED